MNAKMFTALRYTTDFVTITKRQQSVPLRVQKCKRRRRVYRPRPAMLPSSLGSRGEEERCGNAELRSVAVWTGLVAGAGAAAAAGGCGLRRPVRLSKGTGVMDAGAISPVLTGGLTWFLLQQRTGQ